MEENRETPVEGGIPLRHIAMRVAYDGSRFCGSQRQTNGPSVQGELERALQVVLKAEIPVALAGRTDAGVHATGQVAAFFTANQSLPVERVPLALNSVLDRAVRVREAWEADDAFHPRFSAKSRIYRYRIECGRTGNPLLRELAGLVPETLDETAMRRVSVEFLGKQDFAAWQSAGSPTSTTIREIKKLEFRRVLAFESELLEVEIEADGFLYQMVRNIVGALIAAGRGQITGEDVRVLTAGRDRTKCPPPAPPQGLSLVQVNY